MAGWLQAGGLDGTGVDEEARNHLRMAISNGVDYADEFEKRGPSPFTVPEHVANPVWPHPPAP